MYTWSSLTILYISHSLLHLFNVYKLKVFLFLKWSFLKNLRPCIYHLVTKNSALRGGLGITWIGIFYYIYSSLIWHPGVWRQVGLSKHEQIWWRWWNSSWAISNSKRWCCESAAIIMPENLENSAVAIGLEKFCFHSYPKERQCQTMFIQLYNCTHLTC